MVERFVVGISCDLDLSPSLTLIFPQVPDTASTASGFVMPTAKPGDHPYHVKRAPSWMLPVYVSQPIKNGQPQSTITVIRSDIKKWTQHVKFELLLTLVLVPARTCLVMGIIWVTCDNSPNLECK